VSLRPVTVHAAPSVAGPGCVDVVYWPGLGGGVVVRVPAVAWAPVAAAVEGAREAYGALCGGAGSRAAHRSLRTHLADLRRILPADGFAAVCGGGWTPLLHVALSAVATVPFEAILTDRPLGLAYDLPQPVFSDGEPPAAPASLLVVADPLGDVAAAVGPDALEEHLAGIDAASRTLGWAPPVVLRSIAATPADVSAALDRDDLAGLYFVGHAVVDDRGPGLRLAGGALRLGDLLPLRLALPFVFLNACAAGAGDPVSPASPPLVEALSAHGEGRVALAPTFAVRARDALPFADGVFAALAAGGTMGAAVRAARAESWARFEPYRDGAVDLAWATYRLFGDSAARPGQTAAASASTRVTGRSAAKQVGPGQTAAASASTAELLPGGSSFHGAADPLGAALAGETRSGRLRRAALASPPAAAPDGAALAPPPADPLAELTPAARQVVTTAWSLACQRGHDTIPFHLLFAAFVADSDRWLARQLDEHALSWQSLRDAWLAAGQADWAHPADRPLAAMLARAVQPALVAARGLVGAPPGGAAVAPAAIDEEALFRAFWQVAPPGIRASLADRASERRRAALDALARDRGVQPLPDALRQVVDKARYEALERGHDRVRRAHLSRAVGLGGDADLTRLPRAPERRPGLSRSAEAVVWAAAEELWADPRLTLRWAVQRALDTVRRGEDR
jgi:hypothetical protein